MASSRFPGKPLAKINGIPMVGHVYFRSKMSQVLDEVYIATCDNEIIHYAEGIGAKVVDTLDTHKRASDRTAEAMLKIEEIGRGEIDIVVMIQGDEPMVKPEMIDESVKPLQKDKTIQVVNLMAQMNSKQEYEDQNEVKVVVDKNNFALYFSRESIPSRKKGAGDVHMYKQICIIPFRRNFIVLFNNLISTPLERIESIDMLRFLEHGYKIKMVFTEFKTYSVDTIDDLNKVEKLMESDPLVKKYNIGK